MTMFATITAAPAAISAAPVAAAILAAPAVAETTHGAAWYALKVRFDAAKAIEDAHNAIHDAAYHLAEAEMPATPDLTYRAPGGPTLYDFRRATHQLYEPGNILFPQDVKDELRARWEAYSTVRDEIYAKHDLERLGEESERLGDIRHDIECDMIVMPAPDAQALLWKIERLFGEDYNAERDYCDALTMDWVGPLVEDARRLLGGGIA